MQATRVYDRTLRRLLQPLLNVRHAHLRPLLAVRVSERRMSLDYGQPGPCAVGCDGIHGAVRAIHEAGLWVGDVVESIGLDERGRVVLSGVGSTWDLNDPFAGHPSVTEPDLRIRWRQNGDTLQLQQIQSALTRCA